MQSATATRRAIEIMDHTLGQASILSDAQRRNIRLKAEDLLEGRLIWKSTPLCIQFEANLSCQLACIHCGIEHAGDSDLDFAMIEKLLAEAGPGAIEVMPYLRGEPTLAPLEAIADLCRRHNNYLSFTTNGILLDRRRFASIADTTARITFSFQSHIREVFARIEPGADLDRIVQNMRDCIDISTQSKTEVLAGIVIMEENLDHLPGWIQFIADLGFRRVVLTRLNPNTRNRDELDCYCNRSMEEIEGIIDRAMDIAISNGIFTETNIPQAYPTRHPENRLRHLSPYAILSEVNSICTLFRPGFCPMAANMISVTYDGSVRPCCRADMHLGFLREQSLEEIWNGERMQRMRSTFFNRSIYLECKGCLDFFCHTLHPSLPPMQDSGSWWKDENRERKVTP